MTKVAPPENRWGWGLWGGLRYYFIFVTNSYIVYQVIYLIIDYYYIFVK